MEFVQYINERFILQLPVVMLKPFSAILKDFFTDAFVIAWLFISCCAFGYLLIYYLFKYQSDAIDTQANNAEDNCATGNTQANNKTPAIYNKQAKNDTLATNNTQANNDTLAFNSTSGNNTRRVNKLNRATQTLTYYKNRAKTLTRRMLMMEETQEHHGH